MTKNKSAQITRDELRAAGWFTISRDGGNIIRWKHADTGDVEYTYAGAERSERFRRGE